MGIRPDNFVSAVWVLSSLIAVGVIASATAAVVGRINWTGKAGRIERSRHQIQSVLSGLIDGTTDYTTGLGRLREAMQNVGRLTAERLLLEQKLSPDGLRVVQRIAEDLGLLSAWQKRLEEPSFSRRFASRFRFSAFLARARNADFLGRIHHQASWPLLVIALNDPSADVQGVALRSLTTIQDPQTFPFLVERLRTVTSSDGLSERELVTALACFPPRMAAHLLPLLDEPSPQVRLAAVNVLRGMAPAQTSSPKRLEFTPNEFGRKVTNLILTRLPDDENADVRAGAADLLGYFKRDERAADGLARLIMDREWYVRLHAVRAVGTQDDSRWALLIAACLTDAHWRVREAAAHVLAKHGPAGVSLLIKTFLETEDAYAREQILEQLELAGITADRPTSSHEPEHNLETAVPVP